MGKCIRVVHEIAILAFESMSDSQVVGPPHIPKESENMNLQGKWEF